MYCIIYILHITSHTSLYSFVSTRTHGCCGGGMIQVNYLCETEGGEWLIVNVRNYNTDLNGQQIAWNFS